MIFCDRCSQQIADDDLIEPDNESGDGRLFSCVWGDDHEFSMEIKISTPGYERRHYHRWCFIALARDQLIEELEVELHVANRDKKQGHENAVKFTGPLLPPEDEPMLRDPALDEERH